MKPGLLGRSTGHLDEVGMGYFAHMRIAFGIGARMLTAGAACFLHGLMPGLFHDKASRTVKELHEIIAKRGAHPNFPAGAGALEFEI